MNTNLFTAGLIASAISAYTFASEDVKLKFMGGVADNAQFVTATTSYDYVVTGTDGLVTDSASDSFSQSQKSADNLGVAAVGLEYQFTDMVGMEGRYYFGINESEYKMDIFESVSEFDSFLGSYTESGNNFSYTASVENAAALLVNLETPKFHGLSVYAQGGFGVVTNGFGNIDVSKTNFVYGGGVEYAVSDQISFFADYLVFPETGFSISGNDIFGEEGYYFYEDTVGDDTREFLVNANGEGRISNNFLTAGFIMKF